MVYVAASATEPSNVTTDDVYHENTEWTTSKSGTPIDLTSTSNPHAGTKDIEATVAVTGNYAQFVATGDFDPAGKGNLVFWIRSKATWASTRSLQFIFLDGTRQKGSAVVLNEGAFGFSSSNTTAYQQIVVPVTLFAANGITTVDRLRATVAGSGTGIGFYLDDIMFQVGLPSPVAPSGVTWCGAWAATTAYPVNCQVTYSNATWVAMAASTNNAPTTSNANWAKVSPDEYKAFGCTFDGGGGAKIVADGGVLITGTPTCYSDPFLRGGTIVGYSILAVGASPTATVDVWKIASGTALPTNTDTITGGQEAALAAGNRIQTTTAADIASWTKTITAGDVAAVNLDAVANATWLTALVYYTEN